MSSEQWIVTRKQLWVGIAVLVILAAMLWAGVLSSAFSQSPSAASIHREKYGEISCHDNKLILYIGKREKSSLGLPGTYVDLGACRANR